ncbi:hypothetical protein SAMN06296952_2303 [Oscillospiraceae bacterium]|nr:hypothetical protein SAMN06296952_2303 [Oscillospiraceae bacterium]
MEETIKRIAAEIDRKKVQSLCKKILKKCSFRSTGDLSNVTELASWLYIYGYLDEAIAVCDLLSPKTIALSPKSTYNLGENRRSWHCVRVWAVHP